MVVRPGRRRLAPESLEEQLRGAQRLAMAGRLAMMSVHELSNYLSIVLGNAELIRESIPPDHAGGRLLDALVLSASHAARMSRQLRMLASPSPGDLRRLDLAEVAGETFAMMGRSTARVLMLEHTAKGELPVWGDAGWIDQILVNLVLNAVDATREGGRVVIRTGRVRAGGRRGWGYLEVVDEGAGVPLKLRRKMRELFFTTKKCGRRSGIGLALACELIEKMGGDLLIRSREGRGATFRVVLPPESKLSGTQGAG